MRESWAPWSCSEGRGIRWWVKVGRPFWHHFLCWIEGPFNIDGKRVWGWHLHEAPGMMTPTYDKNLFKLKHFEYFLLKIFKLLVLNVWKFYASENVIGSFIYTSISESMQFYWDFIRLNYEDECKSICEMDSYSRNWLSKISGRPSLIFEQPK